jgi:hypothetical protein
MIAEPSCTAAQPSQQSPATISESGLKERSAGQGGWQVTRTQCQNSPPSKIERLRHLRFKGWLPTVLRRSSKSTQGFVLGIRVRIA